jgi:hypothetical protein
MSSGWSASVADCAGTLVLSPARSEDGFLVTNALKDARSILIRRKRRDRARGMIPLLGSNAGDDPLEVAPEVQRDKTYAASRGQGTEHTVGWREIYAQLAKLVAQRNRHAAACLDAWRDGADLNETAARLGISRDYGRKLRGLIRTVAATAFPEIVGPNPPADRRDLGALGELQKSVERVPHSLRPGPFLVEAMNCSVEVASAR